MRLVKIVDVTGTVLGYIPPIPNLIGMDGTPNAYFELVLARKDPSEPRLVEPVPLRLYIDRSGDEHTTYRVYENAAEVRLIPGFQPRPAGAPGR